MIQNPVAGAGPRRCPLGSEDREAMKEHDAVFPGDAAVSLGLQIGPVHPHRCASDRLFALHYRECGSSPCIRGNQ